MKYSWVSAFSSIELCRKRAERSNHVSSNYILGRHIHGGFYLS